MSREQVIAEMRRKADEIADYGISGMRGKGIIDDWCNRLEAAAYVDGPLRDPSLSTPAAEQGDAAVDIEDNCNYIEHCAGLLTQHGYTTTVRALLQIADDYRQLQASNAEMAAEIERWKSNEELQMQRANRAESKLSALLAGIAGLEQKWHGRCESWADTGNAYSDGVSITFADCADDLKAFREGVENG